MFVLKLSLDDAELRVRVRPWNKSNALAFVLVVSGIHSGLFLVAGFAAGATISIPSLPFPVTTRFLLPIYGYLLPGLFCLFVYPEARASLRKVEAGRVAYAVAIVVGQIPFLSYWGSNRSAVPLTFSVAALFMADFFANVFLRPLWEQVIWRAVFQKKVRSFCSAKGTILLTSVACDVWYAGYLAFLAGSGTPTKVVACIGLIFFCWEILLGSLYEISRGSLWPCIVLQTGLTASEIVYYAEAHPSSEFGPRLAELLFLSISAGLLFWIATRQRFASDSASIQQTAEGL